MHRVPVHPTPPVPLVREQARAPHIHLRTTGPRCGDEVFRYVWATNLPGRTRAALQTRRMLKNATKASTNASVSVIQPKRAMTNTRQVPPQRESRNPLPPRHVGSVQMASTMSKQQAPPQRESRSHRPPRHVTEMKMLFSRREHRDLRTPEGCLSPPPWCHVSVVPSLQAPSSCRAPEPVMTFSKRGGGGEGGAAAASTLPALALPDGPRPNGRPTW